MMGKDIEVDELSLAGFTLYKKEIGKLPTDYSNQIKESGQYKRNACHMNSRYAAIFVLYPDCENRIVEGIVICEDGLCFEHFWNRVCSEKEEADFDLTLDVIGSDHEKCTPKKYFEYKTYKVSEMRTDNSFSIEMNDIVVDYYRRYPEHKERYFQLKAQIDGKLPACSVL